MYTKKEGKYESSSYLNLSSVKFFKCTQQRTFSYPNCRNKQRTVIQIFVSNTEKLSTFSYRTQKSINSYVPKREQLSKVSFPTENSYSHFCTQQRS